MFPIRKGMKQGDVLSPLLFSFVLGYAIKTVQLNQDDLKLNGTHQLLFCVDYVNIWGGSVHAIKEKAKALLVASKEIGLEVNADRTKYMVMFRDQNTGRSHSIKSDNSSFEKVEEFKCLGTNLTNQNYIQEEMKSRLKSGNACFHSVQFLLSSCLLSKNMKKIKIFRNITLPLVLYGCETWSLILREEHRLRLFENRVLSRIFRPKRDEVTGVWLKLHNEELNDQYSSPNIVLVIKLSIVRWAGQVARMEERRGVYRFLVGKPEGKRSLGKPRCRWEDNIKMNFQEVRCSGMDWIELAQDRDRWRAFVNGVMSPRVP